MLSGDSNICLHIKINVWDPKYQLYNIIDKFYRENQTNEIPVTVTRRKIPFSYEHDSPIRWFHVCREVYSYALT